MGSSEDFPAIAKGAAAKAATPFSLQKIHCIFSKFFSFFKELDEASRIVIDISVVYCRACYYDICTRIKHNFNIFTLDATVNFDINVDTGFLKCTSCLTYLGCRRLDVLLPAKSLGFRALIIAKPRILISYQTANCSAECCNIFFSFFLS